MAIVEDPQAKYAIWVIVALGALNWGLSVVGLGLFTDVLMLNSNITDLLYLSIGGAGAVNLLDLLMEGM
jgi:uncharacterized membrane protein YuzA (DUF378 family)